MNKQLEIRELKIDDLGNLGVSAIAFVDQPAIEVNFQTFKANKKYFFNDEQRIVTGPAMIPDMNIFRSDESGEYYVKFSKETIKDIVFKFFKTNANNNVNLNHNSSEIIPDVIQFESWIVDERRGVQSLFDKDFPQGTWIVSYKVLNDDTWAKIKSGEVKGFSVEGLFSEHLLKMGKQIEKNIPKKSLKTEFGIFNNMNVNMNNKLKQAIKLFNEAITGGASEIVFSDVMLEDGKTTIQSDTDPIAVGSNLTILQGSETIPVADGEYKLADGNSITVVNGVVTELEAPSEEAEEDATEATVTPETMKKEMSEPVEMSADTKEKFEAMTKEIIDLKNLIASMDKKHNEFQKITGKVIEALNDQVAAPIENKTSFNKDKQKEKQLKMEKLFSTFNEINKK